MLLFDLIDVNKLKRALVYVLMVVISMWLQTMIFARISFFGAKVLFIPIVVAAIAAMEGGVWGVVFGVICGCALDMSTLSSTVLFLVLCAVIGFGCGVLMDYFLNRRFVSFLILSAIVCVLTALCQMVPVWIFKDAALADLAPVAALQAVLSLPFAVPVYFAAKRIAAIGTNSRG